MIDNPAFKNCFTVSNRVSMIDLGNWGNDKPLQHFISVPRIMSGTFNASPDVSGQLFIEPDQHFSAAFLACQQRHAARILRNVKMISDRKYLSFALCNPIDHTAPYYVIWMHNV
jgi:hypothetical protein